MSPRLYAYGALAILLGLGLWKGGSALYDAGMAAERAVWLEAEAAAARQADTQRRDAQATSDAITDDTRAGGEEDAREARDATADTIETIRYVYRTQPAPECPAPVVPDGVRDALTAAYDSARAAPR